MQNSSKATSDYFCLACKGEINPKANFTDRCPLADLQHSFVYETTPESITEDGVEHEDAVKILSM